MVVNRLQTFTTWLTKARAVRRDQDRAPILDKTNTLDSVVEDWQGEKLLTVRWIPDHDSAVAPAGHKSQSVGTVRKTVNGICP